METQTNGTAEQLSDFFKAHDLEVFRNKLLYLLEAYSAEDYYRKGEPADVIYLTDLLLEVITAAHSISLTLQGVSRDLTPDGSTTPYTRLTSTPEIAIITFFDYRTIEEWRETVDHIMFFALSAGSPEELSSREDTLLLYHYFSKLLEACYAISRKN